MIGDTKNAASGDAEAFEVFFVIVSILTPSRCDKRGGAKHSEAVGNIAGTASEVFNHAGSLKGDVEFMKVICQQMIGKRTFKTQNRIVCDGS